jgi:hypothetical protein
MAQAALISFDGKTWSSTFRGSEPQSLSTPTHLNIELESAVASGAVSHIHING